MAWDHLDIDKPHLAYMILGGFTSLFMLCSLFVKEKLYIGEATVATICGLIFGRHAANLFDPISWGNVDKITLECSRVVLVVQCFAVGVELPKSYMERHWKSVTLLLLPVMTWGWLITSLFIWWMIEPLTWIESLACAACVTATDPVLASSVVGKGKFAKRVPKHLRDLLSAESGCNDGMAFPFIYLAVYIMQYEKSANDVALHWICVTILYECVVGAIFGFTVGYVGRHAIRFAEEKNLIDRESFLAFYFVLALFCAGSGSLLGMDDLLMGFAAGVGFSNDGWFTEKTEESHVSNVIDLLLNLTYFVYLGAIIPWSQFNAPQLGIVPWRLVVIAIFVLLFRRIPIMLMLKPFIPDVKTWREALFAGHFGPIGVGAIFACILTRAQLETHTTQPLDVLPAPGEENYEIVAVIWPITTFLVVSSIIVHGSSIAVFTLGKHINTLTITMSYTQGNEEGPSWMNRLPRLSTSRSSMSIGKESFESGKETTGPLSIPKNFLRRQRDKDQDEGEDQPGSRSSSRKPTRRRRTNAGGPISQSAIYPERRYEDTAAGDTAVAESSRTPSTPEAGSEEGQETTEVERTEPELEVYKEGKKIVIEDEEGNVLKTVNTRNMADDQQTQQIEQAHQQLQEDRSGQFAKSRSLPHGKTEGHEMQEKVKHKLHPLHHARKFFSPLSKHQHPQQPEGEKAQKDRSRRSARAYQFGRTVIVEDEDGEVIKTYSIPGPHDVQQTDIEAQDAGMPKRHPRRPVVRLPTWGGKSGPSEAAAKKKEEEDLEDEHLRFTVPEFRDGHAEGSRRMNKADFIKEIQRLDSHTRKQVLEKEGIPHQARTLFRKDGMLKHPHLHRLGRRQSHAEASSRSPDTQPTLHGSPAAEDAEPEDSLSAGTLSPTDTQSQTHTLTVPSPAYRRSRRDSEDDGTARIPPAELRQLAGLAPTQSSSSAKGKSRQTGDSETGETPAERKRRLAALGVRDSLSRSRRGSMESATGSVGGYTSEEPEDEAPRQVKGRVLFAEGEGPAKKRDESVRLGRLRKSRPASQEEAEGESRGRKRHISWGGEKGRSP